MIFMKVFFFSCTNNKNFQSFIHQIIEEIELLGNELLLDDKNLTLNQTIKLIQKADVCVFESSFPCLKTGFFIAKSLDLDKPTIIFHHTNNNHVSYFLKHTPLEKLILQKYSSMDNIEKSVKTAFNKAHRLRDRRFNFFITPDLLSFLDQESRKLNMTKSMFIRWLISQYKKNSLLFKKS